MLLLRFYLDESEDGNDKVKWKSLTIYHLKMVYRRMKLVEVLDDTIDVRFTPVEELSVIQLRSECLERGLSDQGLKASYYVSWVKYCNEIYAQI